MRIENIDINLITYSEHDRPINKKELKALEESIKKIGIMCPICVHALKNGKYILIDGYMLLTVAKSMGFTTITVMILED